MNTATAITLAAIAALPPTITTLIGIVIARRDAHDFRAEMVTLRAEFHAEMAAMRDHFHAT